MYLVTYSSFFFFFFNDTATTEIYTLSLHDALPIHELERVGDEAQSGDAGSERDLVAHLGARSEEHTSELQSRPHLVCRLLLEKKKTKTTPIMRSKRKTKHTLNHK